MLPYQGNKSAIAQDLVLFLRQSFDYNNFYDLFGGGGSITYEAKRYFNFVHYNEIRSDIFCAVKSIIQGENFYLLPKDEWISREKFFEIKESNSTNYKQLAIKGLVLACWSFGNNLEDYLYSKEIEDWKIALHDLCLNDIINVEVFESRTFDNDYGIYTLKFDNLDKLLELQKGSQRRYNLMKYVSDRVFSVRNNTKMIESIQSIERLESLESIKNIERLQRLDRLDRLENISMTNFSYENVEIMPNSLVYCDIPYNSKSTNGSYGCDYDSFHNKFYNWASSNENCVVFSEYLENVPSEFEIIWQKKKTNLMAGGGSKKSIEVLAWNKKGKINKTTLF